MKLAESILRMVNEELKLYAGKSYLTIDAKEIERLFIIRTDTVRRGFLITNRKSVTHEDDVFVDNKPKSVLSYLEKNLNRKLNDKETKEITQILNSIKNNNYFTDPLKR